MGKFITAFDKESRESIIGFLSNHFTYYTMNSWNLIESYAHNVKLYRLGLTQQQADLAYEMMCMGDEMNEWDIILQGRIEDFAIEHDWHYTICSNGRSGGYFVLIKTKREGNRLCYYPGQTPLKDIDWLNEAEDDELLELAELVSSFDMAVDDIIEEYKAFLSSHKIVQKKIMVEREIKVLEPLEDDENNELSNQ